MKTNERTSLVIYIYIYTFICAHRTNLIIDIMFDVVLVSREWPLREFTRCPGIKSDNEGLLQFHLVDIFTKAVIFYVGM